MKLLKKKKVIEFRLKEDACINDSLFKLMNMCIGCTCRIR